MAEFTNYMVEMDFATAGRPSFFDVWGEQENIPWFGTVRAGQYVQPFSVDAMSGFRHLLFLERSLPFLAFVPFRRVGVEAYNWTEDERTNWAYSVFRTGGFNNAPLGDDRFATDIGDVGGYSFSGRMTHLVYYDAEANDRYLWHIGGAYDYQPTDGQHGGRQHFAGAVLSGQSAARIWAPRLARDGRRLSARRSPPRRPLSTPASIGPRTSTCTAWKPCGSPEPPAFRRNGWAPSSTARWARSSTTAPTRSWPTA